jgi:hypothetical protein
LFAWQKTDIGIGDMILTGSLYGDIISTVLMHRNETFE